MEVPKSVCGCRSVAIEDNGIVVGDCNSGGVEGGCTAVVA
jgi:hypothetical protein